MSTRSCAVRVTIFSTVQYATYGPALIDITEKDFLSSAVPSIGARGATAPHPPPENLTYLHSLTAGLLSVTVHSESRKPDPPTPVRIAFSMCTPCVIYYGKRSVLGVHG